MKKIGRNDQCPCGSGKKYKKCCLNKRKPRSINLTLDFGEPTTLDGISIDPTSGKVSLLCNGVPRIPKNAWIEKEYSREKGPKILSRIPALVTELQIEPNSVLRGYDLIYAIDTNTKPSNKELLSVCGIVLGKIAKTEIPHLSILQFAPANCLEFRNISGKPENVSWQTFIELLNSCTFRPQVVRDNCPEYFV